MGTTEKAVVILSGGLDSTVLAYLMNALQYDIHAVSFNYGQRHSKEIDYAKHTAEWLLGVKHTIVDIPDLADMLDSSLTTVSRDVPEGHYAAESMRATVVPNRNAIMLSIAWGIAVSEGASIVAYGAHGGDHPVYPDCRPEFVEALNKALQLGNLQDRVSHTRLYAPFIWLSKAQIVSLGSKLSVPFHKTWSCYKGERNHCGRCGTCVERKEAFRLARVYDPTEYEDPEYEIPAFTEAGIRDSGIHRGG